MLEMFTYLSQLWYYRNTEVKENYLFFRVEPKKYHSWIQFFRDTSELKRMPSVSVFFITDLMNHLRTAVERMDITPSQTLRMLNHFQKDMLLHGGKALMLECVPEMIEERDIVLLKKCMQWVPQTINSIPTALLLEMIPLNQWDSSTIRQRILYPLREHQDRSLFQTVRQYVEKNETVLLWMLKQPYLACLATHLTPKALQYLQKTNQSYYQHLQQVEEKYKHLEGQNRFSLDTYLAKPALHI